MQGASMESSLQRLFVRRVGFPFIDAIAAPEAHRGSDIGPELDKVPPLRTVSAAAVGISFRAAVPFSTRAFLSIPGAKIERQTGAGVGRQRFGYSRQGSCEGPLIIII
jgi:hypothetical protein